MGLNVNEYIDPVQLDPQAQYRMKLNEVFGLIGARYEDELNKEYNFEQNNEVVYKIKPMFASKYSIAYTAMLDDEAQGITPVINASVYNAQGILVNVDFSKEQFLALYRAVKDIYTPIEKKYQQYLAELSQMPTVERLDYIISHAEF